MNQNNISNPFLENKRGPLGSTPFDLIRLEHFIPALQKGVEAGKKNLDQIRSVKDANFENTIFALETLSELIDVVSGVYFNLHSAEASPDLAKLAPEISAICSNFSSDIFLDEVIFEKVKYVYEHPSKSKLNPEQKKILENTYKAFVRNGALLSKAEKDNLRKVDEELSQLAPKFSDNLLKATNSFELKITQKKDLDGLPDGAITAAQEAAAAKGYKDTWLFNLDTPSLTPFLKYAKNRSLRETLWMAFSSRCVTGEFSNKEIIKKILDLKN